MLAVVLNMPEHSSFQDMLFPMLFISKYVKSYASIMDISLVPGPDSKFEKLGRASLNYPIHVCMYLSVGPTYSQNVFFASPVEGTRNCIPGRTVLKNVRK